MPALRKTLNYRNIILNEFAEGETVGVRLRNGELRQVRWLGLISREEAKKAPHGRPVLLRVHSYQLTTDWTSLGDDEYVQGCLVAGDGVRAVLDHGRFRVFSSQQ